MHFVLETERLRARKLTQSDTGFIIDLLNSPGWLQFIGDRHVKTQAQALQYLENGPLKSYVQYGFGLWLVERKEDKKAIGLCGIIKREYLENPDIGFAFLPDFHGKGYAFEITGATLSYATIQLAIPQLWAIVLAENTRSIRLLERIGFRYIKTFYPPDSKEPLQLYSH